MASTIRQDHPSLTRDKHAAALLVELDRHRRVWEHQSRLGTADLRLLWLLTSRGPSTLRGIADALGLEQSTVNRQVHAALDAGLVQRRREPGQTASLVETTDEGITAFEHDLANTLGAYEKALSQLPAGYGERFLDLLEMFVTAYGRAVDEHPGTKAD